MQTCALIIIQIDKYEGDYIENAIYGRSIFSLVNIWKQTPWNRVIRYAELVVYYSSIRLTRNAFGILRSIFYIIMKFMNMIISKDALD